MFVGQGGGGGGGYYEQCAHRCSQSTHLLVDPHASHKVATDRQQRATTILSPPVFPSSEEPLAVCDLQYDPEEFAEVCKHPRP